MLARSLHVPTGFAVVLGNLCDFEDDSLLAASSSAIEALNMGENLFVAEHLVLEVTAHLDALADAFRVTMASRDFDDKIVERMLPTFGEAICELEERLQDVWNLDIPFREADTRYSIESARPANAVARNLGWIVPGGWTILVDCLSTSRSPLAGSETEPMQILFAATSSHRSIAVYRLLRATTEPTFAGLLWADPIGSLYERVFFEDVDDLVPWLRARLRQDALPRRKKRK